MQRLCAHDPIVNGSRTLAQARKLVAALGIDGLAEVLIETLSDADIDRLRELLKNRCREEC